MTDQVPDLHNSSDAESPLELALRQIAILSARNAQLECRNIEVERRFELESNVLRTLVETCPFRIYAKDTRSQFIYANMELAKAMGVGSPEFLVGKDDFEFFSSELATRYFADEQDMFSSGRSILKREEPTSDPDSDNVWWLLTSKVLLRDKNDQVIGLVGIGLDVTERKLLEQQLVQKNNDLSALNQKLLATQNQLIQIEKLAALSYLVAGISHELNTPLGNCLMATTTMHDNISKLSQSLTSGLTKIQLTNYIEHAIEGISILERNIQRAANLISSFKKIAVVQTSERRSTFKLNQTVEEILLLLQPMLNGTNVTVTSNMATDIIVDSFPEPLGQILINLLTNSVLHGFDSRKDGQIVIAASICQDQVILTVQDNGRGIPETYLAHVFDPFFTTKLGSGGSGLGLHLSYNIATGLLGGTLTVESQLDQGTKFTLSIPITAPIISTGTKLNSK